MPKIKKILALVALAAVAACAGPRVKPQASPDDADVFGAHSHAYSDLPATVTRSDGSIPFTAPIPGVAPIAGADLATKTYVDATASGASATKKVLVSSMDTTENYLDSTVAVGSTLTKTIVNSGADETLRLDVAIGTTAGTVAAGDDSRFTNSRAPSGTAGGDLQGTYPNPTFLYDRLRLDTFTTKGDLMATWAAGDVRRLPVGANGDVLFADSAEAAGVRWGSFDSVFSHTLLSHGDCYPGSAVKGSLLVGNATPLWDALPVGTNGYYLVADSGEARGIKWAALSIPTSAVTTTSILDGTILNIDVDASAAIAWSKISKSGATAADVGAAATSHAHAAGDITSGTVDTARLGSGTANSSTYLRGDQTWTAPPAVSITMFIKANPSAAATAAGMGWGTSNTAYFVPIYAGTIRGFSWYFTGTHSAGTITFRARKNGAGDNTLNLVSGTSDTYGQGSGTGVTFAAGDTLGVEYDTSGTWNGTAGQLSAVLWVSYNN